MAPAPGSSGEVELQVDDLAASQSGRTEVSGSAGLPVPFWHDPETLVGAVLSERYKLLKVIGQGGMGAVFLAEHIVIGKTIAVKVLSPEYSRNPGDVQRFLQEARAASLIQHDHIVDISDFGYTPQGQAYLVMEYLDGEDLAHAVLRHGRMPWFRVTNLILQTASALAAAHAKGVIHRDMKPENCFLVRRDDGEDFVKVLDFGIAKIVDERLKPRSAELTLEGGIIGTPEYIAPELVRGLKADARVDIYALGVVMYRLLTAELPFAGDGRNYMAILTQHLLETPRPPSERAPDAGIPRPIEAIVLRALAKDPAARYQTVDEMIAALREAQLMLTGASSTGLLSNLPIITPKTLRASSGRRRRRRLWTAFALACVAFGGVAVGLALRGDEDVPGDMPAAPGPSGQVAPGPAPETRSAPPPETKSAPPGDATTGAPLPPLEPEELADDGPRGPRKGALSDAEFRREVGDIQRAVKSKCQGLPGMQIRAKIYIDAAGSVARVVPEGALAGSSFGTCVVKQIRAARFKKAGAASVRSATFKI